MSNVQDDEAEPRIAFRLIFFPGVVPKIAMPEVDRKLNEAMQYVHAHDRALRDKLLEGSDTYHERHQDFEEPEWIEAVPVEYIDAVLATQKGNTNE